MKLIILKNNINVKEESVPLDEEKNSLKKKNKSLQDNINALKEEN